MLYYNFYIMKSDIRRERFIKIAESRTNKIIDMIRLLSNCSNKSHYSYSEEDIKDIFNAIEREFKNARAKFDGEIKKKFYLKKTKQNT